MNCDGNLGRNIQLVIQAHPVDAGSLHDGARHAALLQPLDQIVQVFGERAKRTHVGLARLHRLGRYADEVLRRPHVSARRVQVDLLQSLRCRGLKLRWLPALGGGLNGNVELGLAGALLA